MHIVASTIHTRYKMLFIKLRIMEDKVIYDNRIFKYLRIANDMKVKELSERFGVSHAHILRIESGAKQPSERLIKEYCKVFGVSERLLKYFHSEISGNEQKGKKYTCKEILLLILKAICNEKDVSEE